MGFTSSYSSVNADRPPSSATSLFGKSSQSFSSSFGGSPYSQTASMDFTFGTPHDKDSLFKASVAGGYSSSSSSSSSSSGLFSDEEDILYPITTSLVFAPEEETMGRSSQQGNYMQTSASAPSPTPNKSNAPTSTDAQIFSEKMKIATSRMLSDIDDEVLDYVSEAQKSESFFVIEEVFTDESSTPVKNTTGIFVPSCTDRSFWDSYTMPKSFIQAVQYFMETPIPDWSDNSYLTLRKNGSRLEGQAMLWARQVRLPYLVLAECKFNNGTFLEAVESTLVALSTQRSWAYPAADYDLQYFNGEMYFMDLSSASISENIGLALYLLEDSLSSSTKAISIDALNTRVFKPLKTLFNGNNATLWSKFWWVSSNSNHNAVIWAAVLITSFCVQNSTDRSYFAQKGIRYSNSYLNSFWADGYASEGVGYWNYGFLNYALVRQTLYEGTGGAYDAFRNPKAASAALFGKEFGMSYGDAANFGDCHFDRYFDSNIVRYVDRSFKEVQGESVFQLPTRSTGLNLAYYLPNLIPEKVPIVSGISTPGMASLRRYYNESGVLVVRPNNINTGEGLYGTIKLCGNFGGHSHDDIGSYVISVNGVKLTGDVGGPLYYDTTTFSTKRYNNPLMNSFGHPVPVVNGNLQRRATVVCNSGTKSVRVLWRKFTESADSIAYNMKGAYNEPLLKSLTRVMAYNRSDSTIAITDTVNFTQPCSFEDVLVSKKQWTSTSSSTGFFSDNNETLFVTITSNVPFLLNQTQWSSYKVSFTRIGIQLLGSVSFAKVSMVFSSPNLSLPGIAASSFATPRDSSAAPRKGSKGIRGKKF